MPTEPTPAIFIPALLCDERLYDEVIAGLADRISAEILLSPRPTLEESAADILARAPASFVLVGTSYGGNLALEVAAAAPDRVRALCLMGCDPAPAPDGRPDLAAALTQTPDAVFDMLTARVTHPDHADAAATFAAMARSVGPAIGAAQATALAVRSDARTRLARLTMPTLVLWGADDALVPVEIGQALADALPHAQFRILDRCGHLPTLERPADTAALLAAFLDTAHP